MENVKEFLKVKPLSSGDGSGSGSGCGSGYGYGCGSGDGYGYGSGDGYGDGYGYGSGDGYGDGYGYGSGYGYGDGDGYGLKSLNNQQVYNIDGLETIVTSVKGNIAKGFIVNKDLTLKDCYIVKNDYLFAHGETIKEANKSLIEKTLVNLPIEQRIENFFNEFKDLGAKYEANKFFDWHYYLTGSCEMGRKSFCDNNGINLETDMFTINEFIALTENAYNSEIIKQLKPKLETKP